MFKFNGVKVFSATMVADRDQLGEKVTAWIAAHPKFEIADMIVTQSSDDAFHCVAITVWYWDPDVVPRMVGGPPKHIADRPAPIVEHKKRSS